MIVSSVKWALIGAVVILSTACVELRDEDKNDFGVAQTSRPGDIYAQMGQEYMKVGQPIIALRKLKRGLSKDPDNPQIHAVLGQLYERLGETKLAEEHFLRAIEVEPQNPFFHNSYGGFLCQRGEYDKANAEFLLALSNPLYNLPWDAQTNAGVCALRAGHQEAGERYLRLALTANSQVPLALFELAKLEITHSRYAEAREYLARYARLAAPSPQSLLLQYKVALGLGDKTAAAQFKDAIIKRFPDAPETQTARGLVLP